MSLATLHTKAMALRARVDGLPIAIAARVTGVDRALAASMATWIRMHREEGEPLGSTPDHFVAGGAAPCFALLRIASDRPGTFYGAIIATFCLPILIALRWVL
ncbi:MULTISPECIES: hypothetical protein [Cupriavidus]